MKYLFYSILTLLTLFKTYAQEAEMFTIEVCDISKKIDHINFSDSNCSSIDYSPLDAQLKKISIKSDIEQTLILRFNNVIFDEFKIWQKRKNESLTPIMDLANNFVSKKYDRSYGFIHEINFSAEEEIEIFYYFNNNGWPFEDEFEVSTKSDFITSINYEQTLKLTCRTILICLVLVGLTLGIMLHKKVYYFYGYSSLSTLFFLETEFGVICNYFPIAHFTYIKYILVISTYLFTYSSFYFYAYLTFSNKYFIKSKIKKSMNIIILIGLISLLNLYYDGDLKLYVNNSVALISMLSVFLSTILSFIVIFRGIKIKEESASLVLGLFIMVNFSVIILSILPYLGVTTRLSYSRILIYFVHTFNSLLFLFLILKKTSIYFKEQNEIQIQKQLIQEKYSLAIIKGQEAERNQIGKELQDYVGLNLLQINQSNNWSSDYIRNLVKHTIQSVRNMSHELVSPEYEREDFEDIIYDLCSKYNTTDLTIHINFALENPINSNSIKNHFYRIIQDLLRNAYDSNEIKEVYLDLILDFHGFITLFYEDKKDSNKSIDLDENLLLKNLSFRVNALGGKIVISNIKKNTIITISEINTNPILA